jgi:hypothetical protein
VAEKCWSSSPLEPSGALIKQRSAAHQTRRHASWTCAFVITGRSRNALPVVLPRIGQSLTVNISANSGRTTEANCPTQSRLVIDGPVPIWVPTLRRQVSSAPVFVRRCCLARRNWEYARKLAPVCDLVEKSLFAMSRTFRLKPEGHRCKSCRALKEQLRDRPRRGPLSRHQAALHTFDEIDSWRPPSAAKARVLHVSTITCCFWPARFSASNICRIRSSSEKTSASSRMIGTA